jgi:hypothetical protein
MSPGFVIPHLVGCVYRKRDDGGCHIFNELAHDGCIKAAYLRFFFIERFLRLFLRRFIRLPAPI